MAEVVRSGLADVAIVSRFHGHMLYHQPLAQRIGMKLLAWTVSATTRRQVIDPTSGFQALNAEAVRFFARDNCPVDDPDEDTLLVLPFAGFTTQEVPVTSRERISGVSMHSGWKPFYYVGRMGSPSLWCSCARARMTTREEL